MHAIFSALALRTHVKQNQFYFPSTRLSVEAQANINSADARTAEKRQPPEGA
jgi:hypothetical protein